MKLDIDFYKKSTKKAFLQAKKELIDNCKYNEKKANDFLEGLYYAVANEYGD